MSARGGISDPRDYRGHCSSKQHSDLGIELSLNKIMHRLCAEKMTIQRNSMENIREAIDTCAYRLGEEKLIFFFCRV